MHTVNKCQPAYFRTMFVTGLLVAIGMQTASVAAEQEATLTTRWTAEVTADNVLPEYPRPQLKRANWQNLNGEWEYAIRPLAENEPKEFEGNILVPFPVESLLSGVKKTVDAVEQLWYRRTFQSPQIEGKQRVLLNFGGVDWLTTVWVNGQQIGKHQGGYDAFTFDITEAIKSGENELVVSVWDPTDAGIQPRGKQISRPHGIWYTAVTGIWQTVWLEVTPESYVQSIKLTPNAAKSTIRVEVNSTAKNEEKVDIVIRDQGQEVVTTQANANEEITIEIPDAKLWSPDSPHLYDVVIETSSGDRVESYFGLRDVAVAKDKNGINRIMLNGEPLFQYGLLDQGWWPDGLYTAPTDEALKYDLDITKKLGFNMVRKHVKVEPARWYYWCDKLGLLVWQDMPSGDKYIGGNDPDIVRTKESGENFENELKAMVDTHHNNPSIVMWIPYNEGWGQWDTERICRLLKQWDPTRLVNSASGWTDRGVGDVHDIHRYPGPAMPSLEEDRAVVLGEFGGLGLALSGHTWQDERNWGYRSYADKKEYSEAYRRLVTHLHLLIEKGLAAAVYTQTTDVEIEVNGILTYDRAVLKLPEELSEANKKLFEPAPILKTLIATSEKEPHEWRYSFSEPSGDWTSPQYDDSLWETGMAGFGGHNPPNVLPRTPWMGDGIWIRRTVEFPKESVLNPVLRMYHDEDVEVYINGRKIASQSGYTTTYDVVPIGRDHWEFLKPGPMTIAVHCSQTIGGQFIDVGIYDLIPRE